MGREAIPERFSRHEKFNARLGFAHQRPLSQIVCIRGRTIDFPDADRSNRDILERNAATHRIANMPVYDDEMDRVPLRGNRRACGKRGHRVMVGGFDNPKPGKMNHSLCRSGDFEQERNDFRSVNNMQIIDGDRAACGERALERVADCGRAKQTGPPRLRRPLCLDIC